MVAQNEIRDQKGARILGKKTRMDSHRRNKRRKVHRQKVVFLKCLKSQVQGVEPYSMVYMLFCYKMKILVSGFTTHKYSECFCTLNMWQFVHIRQFSSSPWTLNSLQTLPTWKQHRIPQMQISPTRVPSTSDADLKSRPLPVFLTNWPKIRGFHNLFLRSN